MTEITFQVIEDDKVSTIEYILSNLDIVKNFKKKVIKNDDDWEVSHIGEYNEGFEETIEYRLFDKYFKIPNLRSQGQAKLSSEICRYLEEESEFTGKLSISKMAKAIRDSGGKEVMVRIGGQPRNCFIVKSKI